MPKYLNLDHDSGIDEYEIGSDFIWVKFNDGSRYLYGSRKPGPAKVEKMKALANSGRGLNSYIKTTIKGDYERKER